MFILQHKTYCLIYLLFFTYLILLSWLVTKISYFKASGLSASWLIGLFLAKVACGILYGFIYSKYADTADTWQIYHFSLNEYKVLLEQPVHFFKTWNASIYPINTMSAPLSYADLFSSTTSYWNMLKDVLLIKIEAIFNVLSIGNYYINIILYAFLTFGGYIAFYRGLLLLYPGSRITSLIAVFFVPSCFFWTSGMYKDGVLFMLLGYIIYQMALLSKSGSIKVGSFFKIIIYLLAIFALRNYIVLILLPTLLAWWLAVKYPAKAIFYFTLIFGGGILLFFLLPYLSSSLNLPALLVSKRQEFIMLPANSALSANTLLPTFRSYLINLPEALNHGFLRPYLWENKGFFYIPFAIELIAFYFLGIYYFIKSKNGISNKQYAFLLFALAFLVANWLLLGYTAPIIGALVRYKSIFIPLIAAHFLYFLFPSINKTFLQPQKKEPKI